MFRGSGTADWQPVARLPAGLAARDLVTTDGYFGGLVALLNDGLYRIVH